MHQKRHVQPCQISSCRQVKMNVVVWFWASLENAKQLAQEEAARSDCYCHITKVSQKRLQFPPGAVSSRTPCVYYVPHPLNFLLR